MLCLLIYLASPVICIDPGHPSEIGMGTKGKTLTEVAVCWKVALELEKSLESAGYRVVLTKSGEKVKVTNRQRAEIANSAGAALMVRLHCDAGAGSGLATYYPDRAGRIGNKTGPSKDVIAESKRMSRPFHAAVVKSLNGDLPGRGVLTDRDTAVGRKHGALIGSIHSRVPTLLVEMCKLQNRKDEAFFIRKGGYATMANALAEGVKAVVPK